MGRTVDDRVVSMAFETTKFQQGVSTTISSIDKLNASLKSIGKDTNFADIDKSASKVTFGGLTTAIDRLKAKFGRGVPEAADAFADIEKSSGKVGLLGISSALDKVKGLFGRGVPEATEAFTGIEKASGKVTLSGIGQAIDGVKAKFGALQIAGASALGTLVSHATSAGSHFVKSLSFGPVLSGFSEYELKIGSIQTILANTHAAGTTLKDVNKTLNELNHYADKTIYNFGQMTKNIGTFTAAGVDLDTAATSIKGIANLAALSGSNAQQASTAMYQLSQAISSGKVSLMDWRSVENAGMGGAIFKRQLTETAVAMGTLDKSAVSLTGKMKNVKVEGQSFRDSIMAAPGKESWLTSDVLTNTLSQLSGDLSDADLKAQGFNESQIKAIQAQAKMAVNAATKVKTLSQLLDTTKEQVQSGWAETWEIVFGNFGEAKQLFTGISNAIGDFVGKSANARNSVLKDWKALGGRDLLIQSLKEAFEALGRVMDPIKKAFRDIFPRKTGKDLLDLTDKFHDFVQILKISNETQENLRRIFRGFFAVLDIGKEIIKGVFAGVKEMFKAFGDGSGNILDLGGNVGDMLVAFRDWLKEGEKITKFFQGLGSVLAIPIRLLGNLAGILGDLVFGSDETTDSVSGMSDALTPAGKAAKAGAKAWQEFLDVLGKIGEVLGPIVEKIGGAFGTIIDAVTDAFRTGNWDAVFDMIETGLIAGIFLAIKKGLGGGLVNLNFFKGGVIKNLTGSLDTLNGSLKAIQTNIKANTLLQIAGAVALLAASMLILSKIDPEKLASAMAGVTGGLGALMGAMFLMSKMGGIMTTIQMPVIAASMILLATALGILSLALWGISKLDWQEIAKGLIGIGALLLMLSAATKPLSAAGPGMVLAGLGITALAIALNILGLAMKVFASMSWEEMAQGLVGVAGALVAVGLASKLIGPSIILVGPGLIAVGIALNAIALAVKIFGSMDLVQLGKGILAIGVALATIALAMALMPPTLPITAAGLILVGIALNGIGLAIALMGGMDISTLAKGIIAMAAALVVLAVGVTAMSGTLAGAAALMVTATALAVLVPVIGILGKMKWTTIAKGLGAIAIGLIALALVGTVASGGLIALGIAIGALGAGLLVVSAAVYLMLSGLKKLAGEGSKNMGVAIAAFAAFIAVLPKIIIEFIKGLVLIVAEIVKLAPEMVKAGIKIISALVDGIIEVAPKVADGVIAIVKGVLKVIRKTVPEFIKTGIALFLGFLKGIEKNAPKIIRTVANIIIGVLKAITKKLPDLVEAGVKLLLALLKGISKNIEDVTRAGLKIVVNFLKAVGSKARELVNAGLNLVVKILKGIGDKARDIIDAGGRIIVKLLQGVADAGVDIVKAGVKAATKFVNALANQIPKLVDNVASAVIKLMHKLADVIENRSPEFLEAAMDIGVAIVKGMILGLYKMATTLISEAKDMAGDALDAAKSKLHIGSPSKAFEEVGKYSVLGFAQGFKKNSHIAATASSEAASEVLGAFASSIKKFNEEEKEVVKILGGELGTTFVDAMLGIVRDPNPVDAAIAEVTANITERIGKSNDKIQSYKDKIDKLNDGKENKKQKNKIKALKANIDEENRLKDALARGSAKLKKGLADEKTALNGQIKLYNDYNVKIEAANDKLNTLISDRDAAITGFVEQYSALPDIVREITNAEGETEAVDPLKTYIDNLTKQIAATKKFQETLAQLREMGLDDATYQKLLAEGTVNQDFIDALIKGGPEAVAGINDLDTQLVNASVGLAQNINAELYQAGIDAADGFVKGLEKEQDAIYEVMKTIAHKMVKAIKKELKIKSPSEEFALMGKFSMLGMAKGLEKTSKKVTDAVTGVSEDALIAMKEKMKRIAAVVQDHIDPNPRITPILDLSDVQNGSKSLHDMMRNVLPISAAASYGQATSISSAQIAAKLAEEAIAAKQAPINFEQNNYSPEALSDIEIYRRTKNALAQARPVLTSG